MDNSISIWLSGLKRGDEKALQEIWQVYFEKLARMCRRRLEGLPRRVADEEDVALSAFNSFCEALKAGRFPQLEDRDDLWKILVTIACRKAFAQHKWHRTQKRGGNQVRGESVFAQAADEERAAGLEQFLGEEPTPDAAAAVAETCDRLLQGLGDPLLVSIAVKKMQGFSNDDIAQELDCTTRTIERKLAAIRQKWDSLGDGA